MRMIRWHNKEFVHFITNRTHQEMFFLLPTPKINSLILFWLSKAKHKKGGHIELYGFIFMANHFHMLARDPKGELAEFMGYFQGNLAKAVNKEIGRRGTFWSREYDDVIVEGENEFINRYQYIAANPVEAGLVEKPDQWGGISSVSYAINNLPVVGTGLNVTEYGNATRHNRKANKKDYEETYEFSLASLPMLEGKSAEEQSAYLQAIINDSDSRTDKEKTVDAVMGMKRILAQSPFDRPASPANSPRFKFLSFCEDRKEELKEMYKTFVASYRECTHVLMRYFSKLSLAEPCAVSRYVIKAPIVIWPPGCYMSSKHQPIAA